MHAFLRCSRPVKVNEDAQQCPYLLHIRKAIIHEKGVGGNEKGRFSW